MDVANLDEMRLSSKGKALLREMEGCSYLPRKDSTGAWTIGIGHKLTQQEVISKTVSTLTGSVSYKNRNLSDGEVDAIFEADIADAADAITYKSRVPLTQNQFDALCCFAFNVGAVAFARSGLLVKLNAGLYENIPVQLRRWVKIDGVIIEELRHRREREIALWEGR